MNYADTAYATAIAAGKTADDVAAMGYAQIAALCKVKVEINGDSSAAFHYRPIRRKVCGLLLRGAWNTHRQIAKTAALAAVATSPREMAAVIESLFPDVPEDEDTSFDPTVHEFFESQGINH